jgi:hypothetical protein
VRLGSSVATFLLLAAAQRAGAAPGAAQPRTVVEIGGVAIPSPRGTNVFFEPLLDTTVVAWTTAKASPKGCLAALHALPIRPTALAWDGKARELLHAETSVTGCDRLPATRTRALGSEVWGTVADGLSVRLGGLDYDGKAVEPVIPPHETDAAGPIDLYRLGGLILVKTSAGVLGWKLEPSPTPVKVDIRGITAAHPGGWLITSDGGLRPVSDATARLRPAVARLPPTPPSDPPLLVDDGQNLVVVGCPGGAQIGVWRAEGDKGKPRKVFTGHGLGCPRAARVTEDGRILIASLISGKDGRRESAFLTLVGRSGKPLGASLRVELDPSNERDLGLAYAGGDGRLVWAVLAADGAVVRGADFTVTKDRLLWSAD